MQVRGLSEGAEDMKSVKSAEIKDLESDEELKSDSEEYYTAYSSISQIRDINSPSPQQIGERNENGEVNEKTGYEDSFNCACDLQPSSVPEKQGDQSSREDSAPDKSLNGDKPASLAA